MEKRQDRIEQDQDTLEGKVDYIKMTVTELRITLLGTPGTENGGAIKKLNEVCTDHAKLKTLVYALIGVLAGSGVLGTGIWSAIRFG